MVTVANLNQPAPPLNDIVVELSVPISFGVSVISAESALPFTLRAEGTRPFALSFAAFTAFGVAASVSDVLLVALLSWTIPFCAVVASCAVYFPLARSYAALTAFGVAACDSEVLLVALLSCTIPFFVVLASSSATADAISSARFAAVSARVAADSAVLLL